MTEKETIEKRYTTIPIGAIVALLIFLATVYYNFWSKLPDIGQWALAIGLIILFFSDYTHKTKTTRTK